MPLKDALEKKPKEGCKKSIGFPQYLKINKQFLESTV